MDTHSVVLVVQFSYGRGEGGEAYTRTAVLTRLLGTAWAAAEHPPVTVPDLAHAYSIDDGICEKVQHRHEVDQVELNVQNKVRGVLHVHVCADEVEHHIGQPEDYQCARQQQRRHKSLVVGLRRIASPRVRITHFRWAAHSPDQLRCTAAVGDNFTVDPGVQPHDNDDEAGEGVRADLQRASGHDTVEQRAVVVSGHDQHEQTRCGSQNGSQEPRQTDTQPGLPAGHPCRREQRAADGDVLVERQHEQRERAAAERKDERGNQHQGDEKTVLEVDNREMGEEIGGVIVHPQQG